MWLLKGWEDDFFNMLSFLIVLLFVAGSIGLIIAACNVKDDYPSEQDWEKTIIELERLHEMFSHVLDDIENKDNNHNEKEDDF